MINRICYIEEYLTVPLKEEVYEQFKDCTAKNEWTVRMFCKNRPSIDGNGVIELTRCALWAEESFKKQPILVTLSQRASVKNYTDENGVRLSKYYDITNILVSPNDIDVSQINRKDFIDSARSDDGFGFTSTAKENREMKEMLESMYDGDMSKYVIEAERGIQSIKDGFYNEYLLEWNDDIGKIFQSVLCDDVLIYNPQCKIEKRNRFVLDVITEDGDRYELMYYWINNVKKDLHDNPGKYKRKGDNDRQRTYN